MSTTKRDEVVEAITQDDANMLIGLAEILSVRGEVDMPFALQELSDRVRSVALLIAEVRSVLEDAEAELQLLGRELEEINDGHRRIPSSLLNPAVMHRIHRALDKIPAADGEG